MLIFLYVNIKQQERLNDSHNMMENVITSKQQSEQLRFSFYNFSLYAFPSTTLFLFILN